MSCYPQVSTTLKVQSIKHVQPLTNMLLDFQCIFCLRKHEGKLDALFSHYIFYGFVVSTMNN